MDDPRADPVTRRRLGEVAWVFARQGLLGFGGPAAHLALMEDEVVVRRRWICRERFLDLVGATNLIPGPNSTEMAIHLGYLRAGWPGLVAAGVSFILPAALISTALAWAYVRYGGLPEVEPFLWGIKPAVVGVIFTPLWRLGGEAARGWRHGVLGLAVGIAAFRGLNEVAALLGGGLAGMLWLAGRGRGGGGPGAAGGGAGPRAGRGGTGTAAGLLLGAAALAGGARRAAAVVLGGGSLAAASLWDLGAFFLKVGAVLYGSGYVLVAFLEGGLVGERGWITRGELLDAVAVGQFTPGPLLSTAAFVGYLVAGGGGAAVATVAIFLPSFLFVAVLQRVLPRLRSWPWTGAFLDAVNVSAVALMAVVTVKLGEEVLTGPAAWGIAAAAAAVRWCWKVSPFWLVLAGALAGWVLAGLG